MFNEFCSKDPSLKICGVRNEHDIEAIAQLGVHALGFNFWPKSKRYCEPDKAAHLARLVTGRILRVGVFVNNAIPLASDLIEECVIDAVQLHGDETQDDIHYFTQQNIPVILAKNPNHLPDYPLPKENFALLIDTPAGKDYGGTGKTFDWQIAAEFKKQNPNTPLILAGGINPQNAHNALQQVSPAALDIASGAEISPGIKDIDKVQQLLDIVNS